MSDKTNLADLLALNLHNFEDEVRNIVDKATKELSMEKTLKELEVTWSQMQFETEPHLRTGSNLLKSNEELIETLEENQVSVMCAAHLLCASLLDCAYTCRVLRIISCIFKNLCLHHHGYT